MTSAVISVSQESKKAENKRILSRLKANLALAATFQEMLTENILNQQKLLEYEQSMSDKLTGDIMMLLPKYFVPSVIMVLSMRLLLII